MCGCSSEVRLQRTLDCRPALDDRSIRLRALVARIRRSASSPACRRACARLGSSDVASGAADRSRQTDDRSRRQERRLPDVPHVDRRADDAPDRTRCGSAAPTVTAAIPTSARRHEASSDDAAYQNAKRSAHPGPAWRRDHQWPRPPIRSARTPSGFRNRPNTSSSSTRAICASPTARAASCHASEVQHVRTSMMTHGAMLWGAALYNNGAIP